MNGARIKIARVGVAIIGLVFVAGCASVSEAFPSTSEPASSAAVMSAQGRFLGSTPVRIFVSDDINNVVDVYEPNGNRVQQIATGLTYSIAMDAAKDLYVTDAANYVTSVYAPPYSAVSRTLKDTTGQPMVVALETAAGTNSGLAAIVSFTAGYPNVSFYRSGESTPCRTLAMNGRIYGIESAAFDGSGTLYALGEYGNDARVAVVQGGCKANKVAVVKPAVALQYPLSLQVAANGRISILDDNSGTTISTYNPPVNGSLGSPVSKTSLNGVQGSAGAFIFSPGDGHIWVTATDGKVREYAFPSGGNPITAFAGQSSLYTIAVSPPAVP